MAWHIQTTGAEQVLDRASSYRLVMPHCLNSVAVHYSSASSQSVHRCQNFLVVVASLTLVTTEKPKTKVTLSEQFLNKSYSVLSAYSNTAIKLHSQDCKLISNHVKIKSSLIINDTR